MSDLALKTGLFAFQGDTLHTHFQTTPDWDHVTWFTEVGLPSSGPQYDSLLRGKILQSEEDGSVLVAYYGTAYLSEFRFAALRQAFCFNPETVTEKMLSEPY